MFWKELINLCGKNIVIKLGIGEIEFVDIKEGNYKNYICIFIFYFSLKYENVYLFINFLMKDYGFFFEQRFNEYSLVMDFLYIL